jgi:8-oxo-dGTP diphosphatase
MIPFVCVLAPGSPAPQAHEHVALAWVTPDELTAYDLAPADWPVVASYRQR